MRQVGIRPGGVEDGCWEVGKNLYSRPVGFNLVVAGNGIYFLRICRPPYANYLGYGDSKMRLTCDSMVCIYEILFRTEFYLVD